MQLASFVDKYMSFINNKPSLTTTCHCYLESVARPSLRDDSRSNPTGLSRKTPQDTAFLSLYSESGKRNWVMSDGGYKIRNRKEIHFVTFAVAVPIAIGRVDVFARKEYRDILIESLRFCQTEKSLLVHGWCVMSNHVYLIASARNENLSDILRDFKKFTSKRIIFAQLTAHGSPVTCYMDIHLSNGSHGSLI